MKAEIPLYRQSKIWSQIKIKVWPRDTAMRSQAQIITLSVNQTIEEKLGKTKNFKLGRNRKLSKRIWEEMLKIGRTRGLGPNRGWERGQNFRK